MGRSEGVGRGVVARWLAGWVAGVQALDPARMIWPAPDGGEGGANDHDPGGKVFDAGFAAAGHDGSVAGVVLTKDYDVSEAVTPEYEWGGAGIERERGPVGVAGVGAGRAQGMTNAAGDGDRAEGKRR